MAFRMVTTLTSLASPIATYDMPRQNYTSIPFSLGVRSTYSPSRSTVEIKDAVQVSFAESSYTVEEGGDGVEVVVKLNKPSNNLRVPLTANAFYDAGHQHHLASRFTGRPRERHR